MDKIILNWCENNPKVKCKKDVFISECWFQKGVPYQICNIAYFPDDDGKFIIYILMNTRPFMFISGEGGAHNVFEYFEGVESIIKKAMRKTKLEEINEL